MRRIFSARQVNCCTFLWLDARYAYCGELVGIKLLGKIANVRGMKQLLDVEFPPDRPTVRGWCALAV
jgi:hypothetical protein